MSKMSAVRARVAIRPPQPSTTERGGPSFEHDVMRGLAQRQKAIPATWLHDDRGSQLFERITRLDAYYPARNEALLLERCAGQIAEAAGDRAGRVVFVSGSTFGRLAPDEAVDFLAREAQAVGPDALLVVGADTTQDPAVLIPAYDDGDGVTAAFNLNLLTRINRELGADFSPTAFRHEARFNAEQQRVEMHLVSHYTQRVTVCGHPFQFAMGESIHTGNAYKYSLLKFQHLAARAGWSHRQLWMDGQSRVAVHVLEPSQGAAARERNVIFR